MMGLLLDRQPYSRKKKTDKNNNFCPGYDEQNEERITEDLNMVH
jgi:hypothetical protein